MRLLLNIRVFRLLVAQAMEEKLSLVSANRQFTKYGVKRIW